MKNAIFTICAKNYLAQAKTLADSVKKYAADANFFILLSDDLEGLVIEDLNIVEAKSIGIDDYYDMAFKYDVIEFSTSIKPFFIANLFQEGYEKVIYLDPDMAIFSSLDYLWEELNDHDAILTPHLLKPYIEYEGATTEEELLFVGIYNLGFFAVKQSEVGKQIIDWWMVKLKDQCYADKIDALHVDQRWMDFLPALYGSNVSILRDAGTNIAFWNMHERVFTDNGGSYWVDGSPLKIFHFSGFDYFNYEAIARKQTKFSLHTNPEYKRLFIEYTENLKKNDVESLSKLVYSYNRFDNGTGIIKFQRRLYRALGKKTQPFSTSKGSFYELLNSNGLLIKEDNSKYQNLNKGFDVDKKLGAGIIVLKLLKKLFGIKRYYLLMKFFGVYSRFELQKFLIERNG